MAGKNTALDGRTVRDGLVRVDALGGLLAAKVLLEELLNLGDTGGATDEDDLGGDKKVNRCDNATNRPTTHVVNGLLLDTGVLEHLLDGLHGLAEQVHVELLKLGPGEGLPEERMSHDA